MRLRRTGPSIAVCDRMLAGAAGRREQSIELFRTLARVARRPFGSRKDPRIVNLVCRMFSFKVRQTFEVCEGWFVKNAVQSSDFFWLSRGRWV